MSENIHVAIVDYHEVSPCNPKSGDQGGGGKNQAESNRKQTCISFDMKLARHVHRFLRASLFINILMRYKSTADVYINQITSFN